MIPAVGQDAFIEGAWDVVGRQVSEERLLWDVCATSAGPVALPVHPDSDPVGMGPVRHRGRVEARRLMEQIVS
jgi:hypothetical protein